ncbi:2-succinylbenzoate--CoA ligase [Acaryochloris thomasi RCC1774]|uniref:2-succinylbenzoate--CoA ligase n=1 Tax=Acaryochloris thomasi RCC1774 TaxID=1764569 RepID=A0A2W1JW94_9CYAN|nr:2-succinylbenzoate--CoA ligase [Acaryochloris thomasi]PZD72697.1 2-succinylbenzoate--CoA ligase [Acaryochloris thomasi RCC1774]
MEHSSATDYFQKRLHEQWLLGIDGWTVRTQARLHQLSSLTQAGTHPRILLNLQDPLEFLAAFMAACITESPVFLGNPSWSRADWEQVIALSQPHIIWDAAGQTFTENPFTPHQKSWIMVPTGGSSGKIRFAIHTWSTLMASVQGCQQYFESPTINSCCTLPLHHVSGLMQFLRSFTTGGRLAILPFDDFLNGVSSNPALAAFLDSQSQEVQAFFLSLVPTQLQRLLQRPERLPWLARFQTVLLGGAPAWPELLNAARKHKVRLAPTYGMTETASQVATLKPDDFLAGHYSSGQVLPHAQVLAQDDDQRFLPRNQTGRIAIQSQSLCLGYYPERFANPETFVTDDLGYLCDEQPSACRQEQDAHISGKTPHLHVVGRDSRKIISGGENIFPEEVEAAIRATGLVKDVYVTGAPDSEWGEVAIALYVPITPSRSVLEIQAALQNTLSKLKYPKRWIAVEQIPRNAQGKVSQMQVAMEVRSHLSNGG